MPQLVSVRPPRRPVRGRPLLAASAAVLVALVTALGASAGPLAAADEPSPAPTPTDGSVVAPTPGPTPGSTDAPTAGPTPVPSDTGSPVPVVVRPVFSPDARMAAALSGRVTNAHIGPHVGALVVDAATGTTVWAAHPASGVMPASTAKLATALVALRTLGADHRLTTRVIAGRHTSEVVLQGVGDPSLTARQLRAMAAPTRAFAAAHHRTWIDVLVDDRRFAAPTLPTGWARAYLPGQVSPVRALQVDQRARADTSLDAAAVFARAVQGRGKGLTVRLVRRGAAPAVQRTIASSVSEPVGDMVAHMLNVSDNDYAEDLLRLSAIRLHLPATWAGGRAAQRLVLAREGIPLDGVALYDGSGLSRADRIPAVTLVALLRRFAADPAFAPVLRPDALPVAGLTGSLRTQRGRFAVPPTSCARGAVRAKTGTLHDVVALAGYAQAQDGTLKIFAFTENGMPSSLAGKRAVDGLAATVTGCW